MLAVPVQGQQMHAKLWIHTIKVKGSRSMIELLKLA
jgi:hypothetical protein